MGETCRACGLLGERRALRDMTRCARARRLYLRAARLQMDPTDNLPTTICDPCLRRAEEAVHFQTLCHQSYAKMRSLLKHRQTAKQLEYTTSTPIHPGTCSDEDTLKNRSPTGSEILDLLPPEDFNVKADVDGVKADVDDVMSLSNFGEDVSITNFVNEILEEELQISNPIERLTSDSPAYINPDSVLSFLKSPNTQDSGEAFESRSPLTNNRSNVATYNKSIDTIGKENEEPEVQENVDRKSQENGHIANDKDYLKESPAYINPDSVLSFLKSPNIETLNGDKFTDTRDSLTNNQTMKEALDYCDIVSSNKIQTQFYISSVKQLNYYLFDDEIIQSNEAVNKKCSVAINKDIDYTSHVCVPENIKHKPLNIKDCITFDRDYSRVNANDEIDSIKHGNEEIDSIKHGNDRINLTENSEDSISGARIDVFAEECVLVGPNSESCKEETYTSIDDLIKAAISETKIDATISRFGSIKCMFCSSRFQTGHRLYTHLEKKHISDLRCKNFKKFECDICHKSFKYKHNLKVHLGTHEKKEKRYSCAICERKFHRKINFDTHVESHGNKHDVGSKKYTKKKSQVQCTCHICGRGYSCPSTLNIHLKKHNGITYECEECNKTFPRQSNLKRHLKLHTGKKQFKCNKCPAAFTRSDSLTVHGRSHTGERPYRCEDCYKIFTQSSGLRLHIRRFHGRKDMQYDRKSKLDIIRDLPLAVLETRAKVSNNNIFKVSP